MKIIYEIDADAEEFVLENHWDVAVPISFEQYDDTLYVTVYPEAESLARRHFEVYAEDDPFSEEALADIWRRFAPLFEKWGYHDEKFRDRFGYIMRLPEGALREDKILPDTRKLTAKDDKINETTYDLSCSEEIGMHAFGTVRDGKVVSASVTNTPVGEEPMLIEVGVETVPKMRQKGLGSSNLAALCKHLLSKGHNVEYRFMKHNVASFYNARSVGFEVVGRFYDYVGRRN